MNESVPDPMWFEDHVFAINRLSLGTFLKGRDYKSVVALSENMRIAHIAQARSFNTSGALHMCNQYQAILLEHLTAVAYQPAPEGLSGKQPFVLACADYHGLMLATIAVEFANALRDAGDFKIAAIVTAQPEVWRSKTPTDAPAELFDELDGIGAKLSLERAVEGSCISPAWYICQLLALSLTRSIKTATEAVVDRCVAAYVDERETITTRLSPVVAAQIVQRGFEVQTKAGLLLEAAADRVATLAEYRKVSDVPWEDIDVEVLRGKIDALRDCLLELLCSLAPRLTEVPRTGETPDYFGEMYWRLAEECANALYEGRNERFQLLFPVYFWTAQASLTKLRLSIGLTPEYAATYVSDIIIDLQEISGLALLYSELRGGQEWSYCTALWDRHLASAGSAQGLLASLVAAAEYRAKQFTISPRDMVRGRWEQALMHVLRAEGLVREQHGRTSARRVPHRSSIIRAFGRYGSGFVRPHDVFLATYVRARPEAAGLRFGARVNDFTRSVERELQAGPGDGGTPDA